MATLTPTLTLSSTDISSDTLSFSVTDALTIVSPHIGIAKTTVSTTGANNIIQPATDGQTYYMYIKHTGTSDGSTAVATTLNIELTGDTIFGNLQLENLLFSHQGVIL